MAIYLVNSFQGRNLRQYMGHQSPSVHPCESNGGNLAFYNFIELNVYAVAGNDAHTVCLVLNTLEGLVLNGEA